MFSDGQQDSNQMLQPTLSTLACFCAIIHAFLSAVKHCVCMASVLICSIAVAECKQLLPQIKWRTVCDCTPEHLPQAGSPSPPYKALAVPPAADA